jgi:hypothetical protein
MESPWAYSVMVVTILIDAYLLYIFFRVRSKAITNRVRAADTLPIQLVGAPPHDIFGPLTPSLGTSLPSPLLSCWLTPFLLAIHGYMAALN